MTTSAYDLSTFDQHVRPQDDLFRHVNGHWLATTEIPADRARYGSFLILQEEAERAVREIIENADLKDENGAKIKALYDSFMDEAHIESAGIQPIADELELVKAASSIADIVELMGKSEYAGLGNAFGMFVDSDPGDPTRYALYLVQSGLGLPDEAYYREDQYAPLREAYKHHLQMMFAYAGMPAINADAVFELETAIAKTHWNVVDRRDAEKTYNLMTFDQLKELAPFDWDTFLAEANVPKEKLAEVIVSEPSALAGTLGLLTEDRMAQWRAWLQWRIIHGSAPLLSSPFVHENFAFYGNQLSGTPQLRDRWKRAVSIVEAGMGEAVGKIYVDKHFPPASKQKMDVLVANLIEAYRQSISTLSWMSEETRAKALEKLSKFTPKIGYPDKWRDYSALQLDPEDVVGNLRRVAKFDHNREIAKLGAPIDRDEWFMTPQTINAYYNPGFNEIVFPAAILQPPFFNPDVDGAENYGAIGAVIGHEIGHGFDDQGSKFDGDGRLVDWWTAADREAFEQRTKSLIDQYDALVPSEAPDVHVNGALTIGENIGDLGGLAIAWKAYLLSLDGAEPPVVNGLPADQRFFLAWANSWREKRRKEEAERLIAIDPHSPDEFRCNQIVKNLDVFHTAFDTKEGDGQWLPKDQRVAIWS